MAHKLLGKDFLPHDVVAKVTGEAKYAEDFRAEGMVFARLLSSPYPHARVKSIDASAALAMPGVVGVLLPEDVKNPDAARDPAAHHGARLRGRAHHAGGRGRRNHRAGRHREDPHRLRAAALHMSIRWPACIRTRPMRAPTAMSARRGVKLPAR